MSLLVETVDYTAVPADILRSVENTDGPYQVPCKIVANMDHYRYIVCDLCGTPIPDHTWFAADVDAGGGTRVLRCSGAEQ